MKEKIPSFPSVLYLAGVNNWTHKCIYSQELPSHLPPPRSENRTRNRKEKQCVDQIRRRDPFVPRPQRNHKWVEWAPGSFLLDFGLRSVEGNQIGTQQDEKKLRLIQAGESYHKLGLSNLYESIFKKPDTSEATKRETFFDKENYKCRNQNATVSPFPPHSVACTSARRFVLASNHIVQGKAGPLIQIALILECQTFRR